MILVLHIGSRVLREQIVHKIIVVTGHHRIVSPNAAPMTRPSCQRVGEWPPNKTICFGLNARTVLRSTLRFCVAHVYVFKQL